jgi:hypothetical protein
MATAGERRKYVRRDWSVLQRAKNEFWLEQRRGMPAVEALRIADTLRAQVRAARPDWPTAAARAADLAAHVRLAEVLARAAPVAKR